MSDWRKVSDELPVIPENCWRVSNPLLVKCEMGVVPAYFVENNREKGFGFISSMRLGDGGGNMPKCIGDSELMLLVTHWMLLPEPPTE